MTRKASISEVITLLATAALTSLAGCHTNAPTTTEKAVPPATSAPAPTKERVVAPPPSTSTSRDAAPEIMTQDLRTLNDKGYLKPAFFDYQKADLRDDARNVLAADADLLKRYPSLKFVIEGHCDERGTEEYNLALGEQRADAARAYLASLGINTTRMKTISYGKEKPFCEREDEGCWQSNRRAHFLITAK